MELEAALPGLRRAAARADGLRLLVLHGSRSRGESHNGSDWDLGYLAADHLGPAALHADLSAALGSDDVDLVDLARTSALLRFEAARHGRCVHEGAPGAHRAFVLEATLFWCDAEVVIRRAQAAVLDNLPS